MGKNYKNSESIRNKYSIQLTSVFNDEQRAVTRKEYLGQPTIRLRRNEWETSTKEVCREKQEKKNKVEEFQQANLARPSQANSNQIINCLKLAKKKQSGAWYACEGH